MKSSELWWRIAVLIALGTNVAFMRSSNSFHESQLRFNTATLDYMQENNSAMIAHNEAIKKLQEQCKP